MHQLEQLMKCVVRIQARTTEGSSCGTGFLYKATRATDGAFVPVFLTNKHVLEDASEATIIFSLLNQDGSETGQLIEVTVADIQRKIINHPSADVDLCAIPSDLFFDQLINQGYPVPVTALPPAIIASRAFMNNLLPLEEVTMIGYPNGIWDHYNNGAIARKGAIATLPEHDYHGKKQFVVDMACFNGSSGSPVFLANFSSWATRDGSIVEGVRVSLLGVLYAGPQHTARVYGAAPEHVNTGPVTHIPNNLGYVIKAEEILRIEQEIFSHHIQ